MDKELMSRIRWAQAMARVKSILELPKEEMLKQLPVKEVKHGK